MVCGMGVVAMVFTDPADDVAALAGQAIVIRDGNPFAGSDEIAVDPVAEQGADPCEHGPAVAAGVVAEVDDPARDMARV